MTPQERQLVDELFDRLARLGDGAARPQAERAIAEGLARAPHAIYPLVQTVLVQDEALKRADARIRELSGEDGAARGGGFLDSMRNALTGGPAHTSVPSVRPGQRTRSALEQRRRIDAASCAAGSSAASAIDLAARSSAPRRRRPPA